MKWVIFFTLIRFKLKIKKLNLSRAYLAIPILLFNIYKFLKSKKNYIENDITQLESTKLMYSFFISDLILFAKNQYYDTSLYFHHIFCTLSYLISLMNGTPKIYTLLSLPEIMVFGKFVPYKFKNTFYTSVIFFRLPFWLKLLYEIRNMRNKYLKINAYSGGIVMTTLDMYWLYEIYKK